MLADQAGVRVPWRDAHWHWSDFSFAFLSSLVLNRYLGILRTHWGPFLVFPLSWLHTWAILLHCSLLAHLKLRSKERIWMSWARRAPAHNISIEQMETLQGLRVGPATFETSVGLG